MSVDELLWIVVLLAILAAACKAATEHANRADRIDEPINYRLCDCEACTIRPAARARTRAFLVERAQPELMEWNATDEAAFRQEASQS